MATDILINNFGEFNRLMTLAEEEGITWQSGAEPTELSPDEPYPYIIDYGYSMLYGQYDKKIKTVSANEFISNRGENEMTEGTLDSETGHAVNIEDGIVSTTRPAVTGCVGYSTPGEPFIETETVLQNSLDKYSGYVGMKAGNAMELLLDGADDKESVEYAAIELKQLLKYLSK